MLNSRKRWIMVLMVLFLITLACSKKEETKTEGVKQETKTETPAEQKNTMTAQPQEQTQTNTAGQTEEPKTMAGGSSSTMEQPGSGGAAPGGQGEEIYSQSCASCHDTGVAGAPKTGDAEAWNSRIAKGEDMLVQNAINGIGSMPPKGGNSSLSDDQVRAAVNYMVEQSR